MQITIELTAEQEAALNYVAGKASAEATAAAAQTEGAPAVVIAPEDYLRARIADVLASYVAQMRAEDSQAVVEAFAAATDEDRAAVFATLKIDKPLASVGGTDAKP